MVVNDKDGLNRAWFAAIIIKRVWNNRCINQYDRRHWFLRERDGYLSH